MKPSKKDEKSKLQLVKKLRQLIPIGYTDGLALVDNWEGGLEALDQIVEAWKTKKMAKVMALTRATEERAIQQLQQQYYGVKETVKAIQDSQLGLTEYFLSLNARPAYKLRLIGFALIEHLALLQGFQDKGLSAWEEQLNQESQELDNPVHRSFFLLWIWLNRMEESTFITDGLYGRVEEALAFILKEFDLKLVVAKWYKALAYKLEYEANTPRDEYFSAANYFYDREELSTLKPEIAMDLVQINEALLAYVKIHISNFPA